MSKSLGIMQPYFFPYIGYFSLIHYADAFILFDTPQYDRKGWMNRNRVLKPGGSWQYIRAGVKKPAYRASIDQVMLEDSDSWKDRILRQLEHYRKIAPFYDEVAEWLDQVLRPRRKTLVELNRDTIKATLGLIGLDKPISVFSEMGLSLGEVKHPGQWALRISEALQVDEYVNPEGGQEVFDPDEFSASGIRLRFLKHNLPAYQQGNREFESGLSILDVLLFNSVEGILRMLVDYQIR